MKNILLLNGGKRFAHSDGRLNQTLHETALAHLDRRGFDLRQTFIDGGYDIPAEVDKFLWADVVIYQMPGWWMGAPWTVKRYIDEVFTAGHGSPMPTTAVPARQHAEIWQRRSGAGQALHDLGDLECAAAGVRRSERLLRRKGVDAVYFPFHKANQFLGMSGLPTFLAVDVMKRPDVPAAVAPTRRTWTGCSGAPAEFDGGPASLRWMEWRIEIQALGTRPNGHGSAIRAFVGHDPRVIRNSIFPSIRRIRFHRGRGGKDALHEYSNGRIVK